MAQALTQRQTCKFSRFDWLEELPDAKGRNMPRSQKWRSGRLSCPPETLPFPFTIEFDNTQGGRSTFLLHNGSILLTEVSPRIFLNACSSSFRSRKHFILLSTDSPRLRCGTSRRFPTVGHSIRRQERRCRTYLSSPHPHLLTARMFFS